LLPKSSDRSYATDQLTYYHNCHKYLASPKPHHHKHPHQQHTPQPHPNPTTTNPPNPPTTPPKQHTPQPHNTTNPTNNTHTKQPPTVHLVSCNSGPAQLSLGQLVSSAIVEVIAQVQ
ncbi:hypothetical protein J6590_106115, partial [Homalodisca vitripennis]